jgi:hypothetical protein
MVLLWRVDIRELNVGSGVMVGKGLRRREILTPALRASATLAVMGLVAGCGSRVNPPGGTKEQGTDTELEWKTRTEAG